VRMYALLPIVPTLLMTIIGYHQYWARVLTLQSRERELTELAATAQLAALRAQINPHFLFNSLNSIAQLIHTDPDKAEACVERLAELFRYVLRQARPGPETRVRRRRRPPNPPRPTGTDLRRRTPARDHQRSRRRHPRLPAPADPADRGRSLR